MTLVRAYLCFACLVNCNLAFCKQWGENRGKAHDLLWQAALTDRERAVRVSSSLSGAVCVHNAGQLCLWVCCLTWMRRGLTLAESPRVVNVLLAHIAHTFPLEALLREGVTSRSGKLRTQEDSHIGSFSQQINRLSQRKSFIKSCNNCETETSWIPSW